MTRRRARWLAVALGLLSACGEAAESGLAITVTSCDAALGTQAKQLTISLKASSGAPETQTYALVQRR